MVVYVHDVGQWCEVYRLANAPCIGARLAERRNSASAVSRPAECGRLRRTNCRNRTISDNAEPVRDPKYDHVFSARIFQQILLERLLNGSQNVTQTTPDQLQNAILILYEKSGTAFEEKHLRMVTERGLYGIGLILIDTFCVLYPPAIYRTLDIEEYTYWHFVNESHRVAAVDTYKRIIRNIRRSHFKRTLRTFVKYRRSILAWYETTLTRLYHPSLHLIIVPLQSSNPLDNLQMVHLPGGSLFQETAERFRAMCTDNREDAEVYAISEEDLDRLRHRAVDRANGPFRQRDEN